MWIKTLNLIFTPMVYSTLPLIHIGPDANYYWEQKMDRYLDEFIGSMMEKQVYRNGIFKTLNEYIIEIFSGIRGPQGIRDSYTIKRGGE